MSRRDQLWLAGVIWLGLGIAHANVLLDLAAIAALLIASYGRDKSRQTPPGEA